MPAYAAIPSAIDVAYLNNIHGTNERIPKHMLYEGFAVLLDFLNRCLLETNTEPTPRP